MKTKEAPFKKPVRLIQVFYHVYQYTKSEKAVINTKQNIKERGISSYSGYVSDGLLYLPETIADQPSFSNTNLVTLEDHAGNTPMPQSVFYPQPPAYNRCFQQAQKAKLFIFNLHNIDIPELYLAYNEFEIGLPHRDDFMVCTLKEKEAVEIRINGKNDFSLTGRRTRSYKEQVYVFINLGLFTHYQLLPQSQLPKEKQLPAQRKIIDLRKPLW